jgi:hypothetical protein
LALTALQPAIDASLIPPSHPWVQNAPRGAHSPQSVLQQYWLEEHVTGPHGVRPPSWSVAASRPASAPPATPLLLPVPLLPAPLPLPLPLLPAPLPLPLLVPPLLFEPPPLLFEPPPVLDPLPLPEPLLPPLVPPLLSAALLLPAGLDSGAPASAPAPTLDADPPHAIAVVRAAHERKAFAFAIPLS